MPLSAKLRVDDLTHHFTLYVDEAGDDKIGPLKPDFPDGNSEWLCLGGYLVRASAEAELEKRRDAIKLAIGGRAGEFLHFRALKPRNRMLAAKALASREFAARGFVVCSYKKTMLDHSNPKAAAASGDPRDYLYNYVCRLLLERVTAYVALTAKLDGLPKPKLRIVMASRRGHHFGAFKAYVKKLAVQALAGTTYQDTRVIASDVLAQDLIERMPAAKEPGLQLADVLVSAFFQSIEQQSPHFKDKPALSLRPILARRLDRTAKPAKWNHEGVTLYHAGDASRLLTSEQEAFFSSFGYDFNYLRSKPSQKKRQQFTQAERMWSNGR